MKISVNGITGKMAIVAACAGLVLVAPALVSAHCDTLDGPVVKDARIALEKGEITPVLKWVKKKDETLIRKAFKSTVAAAKRGPKAKETSEHRFFATLVKVHRAGEGAPFTGLKPAGTVEPAVAAADKALEGGSSEALVKLVTDAVANGIRERYDRAAELYRHKDESVEAGRSFVEAYVEYTHYVERLHQDAEGHGVHHGETGKKHGPADGHSESAHGHHK